MFRYSIFIISVILASSTCKSHKEASKAPDSTATKVIVIATETPKDTNMRFIVSFYSIGSGAEGLQMEKFKAFVAEFGKKINKNIYFDTTSWGREGETDYCFPLKELTDDQQNDFIKGTKNLLKSAQWVHYSENMPCRKPEVSH